MTQTGRWRGHAKEINSDRIQRYLARLDTLFSHHELIHFISTYGYGVIVLVIGFECLGLPLPGETILIAAAIYAGRSQNLNIWLVISAAALGAILGNTAGFWVGREGGYRLLLRYGPRLHLTEKRIKLGQYLFLRHGGKIVFFSRFIAVIRVFGALLAGANRMTWLPFQLFNIAGAVAWAILYGAGAYYLGRGFNSPVHRNLRGSEGVKNLLR